MAVLENVKPGDYFYPRLYTFLKDRGIGIRKYAEMMSVTTVTARRKIYGEVDHKMRDVWNFKQAFPYVDPLWIFEPVVAREKLSKEEIAEAENEPEDD